MRKLILILTIALFSVNLFAQQECAFVLEEAQEMFDAGLIETVPDKLSNCLRTGFTNEEKLQAYKLIILSYLFDDNLDKADEFMLKFLTDYPAYEPVATDPREFVLLKETYDTDPVMMLGGGGGASFSFPFLNEPFGVHNTGIMKPRIAPGKSGFHGSFMVERELFPHISLLAELSLATIVFDNYQSDEQEIITPSAEVTDYSLIDLVESQTHIRIPISASYEFMETDFRPYLRAGIVPSIVLSARKEGIRDYDNTGSIRYNPIEEANIDILPIRRMFNVMAFAGGGFNYKLGPGDFFLDLRYHLNLLNQTKPGSNPYQIQELTWELYFVPDNYLLSNLSVSVGYMFPLYRPKKKDQ